MFYRSELSFLCEIFQKCHIEAACVDVREYLRHPDNEDDLFYDRSYLKEQVRSFKSETLYKITDSYEFCHLFLLLPDMESPALLYVGPYLKEALPHERIWEIGEANGISPQKQRYLSEYYNGVQVLTEESPLWTVLGSFCERIWKTKSFDIKEISPQRTPVEKALHRPEKTNALLDIKTMERRYTFENELIRAVELGQPHVENQLKSAFTTQFFEKRASTPLRNAQNYGIIMNTLLRKAAERGGVHPIHIDRVSSEIALKIESLSSPYESSELMREIFRTYCNLVKEQSLKDLPPIVCQTVLMIESDLSADLSPCLLAAQQGVSLGYLSSVFKKSTGQTLSEYVRQKRMEYAAYLLGNTNLQIQTVAAHCGIMDVQYFSKTFKKTTGKTPREFRESLSKTIPSGV